MPAAVIQNTRLVLTCVGCPNAVKPWPNAVASRRKFWNMNSRTDLHWVAKVICVITRKCTQVAKKAISKLLCSLQFSIWSIKTTKQNLRWLVLGGQTVTNLHVLACKFDLVQSQRKSTQVRVSSGQTETQVDPNWQLALTCVGWPNAVKTCVHLRGNLNVGSLKKFTQSYNQLWFVPSA